MACVLMGEVDHFRRLPPVLTPQPVVCSWPELATKELRLKVEKGSFGVQRDSRQLISEMPSVVIAPIRNMLHITKASLPAAPPLPQAMPGQAAVQVASCPSGSPTSSHRRDTISDATVMDYPRSAQEPCHSPTSQGPPRDAPSPTSGVGQKRPREEPAVTPVAPSSPTTASPASQNRGIASAPQPGSGPQPKRARPRLPIVDQYLGLRKDLDLLLTHVAGGLSAQQGLVIATALRELAARINKVCFKAGLQVAPSNAISQSRLRKVEETVSNLQRKAAAKAARSPRHRRSPHRSSRRASPATKSATPNPSEQRPMTPDTVLESMAAAPSDSGSHDRQGACDRHGPCDKHDCCAGRASSPPSPQELCSSTALHVQSTATAPLPSRPAGFGQLAEHNQEALRALLGQPNLAQQLAALVDLENRKDQINDLAMRSLVHYSVYHKFGSSCSCGDCLRLGSLFDHANTCPDRDTTCVKCRGLRFLLHFHAHHCTAGSNCAVPHCDGLQRQAKAARLFS